LLASSEPVTPGFLDLYQRMTLLSDRWNLT
jgi:hypothetical protein